MFEIDCPDCTGAGLTTMSQRCPDCDGHPAQFGECPRCSSEGWLTLNQPCEGCGGRGTLMEVKFS